MGDAMKSSSCGASTDGITIMDMDGVTFLRKRLEDINVVKTMNFGDFTGPGSHSQLLAGLSTKYKKSKQPRKGFSSYLIRLEETKLSLKTRASGE